MRRLNRFGIWGIYVYGHLIGLITTATMIMIMIIIIIITIIVKNNFVYLQLLKRVNNKTIILAKALELLLLGYYREFQ